MLFCCVVKNIYRNKKRMKLKTMTVTWIMFICFPFMLIEAAKFHQTDYTVKEEIVEVVNYNRSYFRNLTCGLVFYNRTYKAINATAHLLKDLNMHIKAELQSYRFVSNEYRFFPITMEISVCKELQLDTFGIVQSFQKSVNVELRCPFKRGDFRVTYGMVDHSLLPPYIPGGRYKNEIKVYENLNFLVELHFYSTVTEIIKKWEH